MTRKGFVSGKISPPDKNGHSEISVAVVDLHTDTVYRYSEKVLTKDSYAPGAMKSFVMNIACRSIEAQYKRDNGL